MDVCSFSFKMRKPVDTLAFREAREAKRLLRIQHPNPERKPDHKRRKERKIEKAHHAKRICSTSCDGKLSYLILSWTNRHESNYPKEKEANA